MPSGSPFEYFAVLATSWQLACFRLSVSAHESRKAAARPSPMHGPFNLMSNAIPLDPLQVPVARCVSMRSSVPYRQTRPYRLVGPRA